MKSRAISVLFPKESKASGLRVFQDRNNQIRGFYFTKDNLNEINNEDYSNNYAVYFLFDDTEQKAYIGQSSNGIDRIKEHKQTKKFWSYCIMFVTDNNSFDKTAIDYLEYKFINLFDKESEYNLVNIQTQNKKPNISRFDNPTVNSYFENIKFLLETQGIVFITDQSKSDNIVFYNGIGNRNCRLYVYNGKFVLAKSSEVERPKESTKEWKDKNHYKNYNQRIDDLIQNGKVKQVGEKLIVVNDIPFNSPSAAANICTGGSENGWEFFKGLKNIKNN